MVMRCLSHRPQLTFLDSAESQGSLGRYSYLASDPFATYMVVDGQATCNGEVFEGLDPWDVLRRLLTRYPQEHRSDLPPFQGGAAGFLAYDLNGTLEQLPGPAQSPHRLPKSILHFYDVVISFDLYDHRCWIISTGWPEQDPARRSERAERRAHEFLAFFREVEPRPPNEFIGIADPWHSSFSREDYIGAVRRVIDLILAGDIFQANIAQRFTAKLPASFDPIAFYGRLRSLSAAPFAALLRYGKLTIASSSPERFLKLDGGQVETRPIKGTIARSADRREDGRRAGTLLASEKDRAENIMIVDLLRNDLSRVCAPHSLTFLRSASSNRMPRFITSYRPLQASFQSARTPSACFELASPAARLLGHPKCDRWKLSLKSRRWGERSIAERLASSASTSAWMRTLESAL